MISNVAKVEERYEKLQNLEETAGKTFSFNQLARAVPLTVHVGVNRSAQGECG